METARTSKQLVRFGRFELDLQSGELFKNGRKLKLPEQPFQVLSLLVAQPGEVVTREELRQKLWPADTFVDFDHSLNAAVNKLREALGDSAAKPRFVETLPRRGYRFIAPLEGAGEGPTEAEKPSASDRKRVWLWLFAACITVLVIGGVVWLRLFGPTVETDQGPARAVPLTSYRGDELCPSFSPEGNQVSFVGNRENQDNLDIYVKMVGSETALRLTTDAANDLSPAWAPDGRQIAFIRSNLHEEEARVFLISPIGGPEREIAQLKPGFHRWIDRQLAWSPDGKSLAVVDRNAPSEPSGIFLLSVETGARRQLISDGQQPSFSPDGGTVAFLRGPWGRDVYVIPINGGEAKQITFDAATMFGLAWTPDGRELVFSSDHEGSPSLWRVSVSGDTPREVVAAGANAITPAISRKGDRLAFVRWIRESNIWKIEPGGVPPKEPLIHSTWRDENPTFSPNGREIAFCSNRSGNWELWICDRDGLNPSPLTHFGGPETSNPSWSPDGGKIAFNSPKEGSYDIYVINVEGAWARRLTYSSASDVMPRWSKDRKWIYFTSNLTGRNEIWRVPPEGGKPEQVTRRGGMRPLVAPDGKYIYYAKSESDDAWSVWRLPVGGREETLVLERMQGSHVWHNSVVVASGIYFPALDNPRTGDAAATLDDTWSIKFFDFQTRSVTQVFPLPKPLVPVDGLAVSPDGRSFLYTQWDNFSSDLMLIENFR